MERDFDYDLIVEYDDNDDETGFDDADCVCKQMILQKNNSHRKI